jgi:hypothetical protein
MGGVVLALIPDKPASATWLDKSERDWLETTLAADAAKIPASGYHGVWRDVTNPVVLLFGAFALFALGITAAFALSAPQILASQTGLITPRWVG